jgi:hypothetical protein
MQDKLKDNKEVVRSRKKGQTTQWPKEKGQKNFRPISEKQNSLSFNNSIYLPKVISPCRER